MSCSFQNRRVSYSFPYVNEDLYELIGKFSSFPAKFDPIDIPGIQFVLVCVFLTINCNTLSTCELIDSHKMHENRSSISTISNLLRNGAENILDSFFPNDVSDSEGPLPSRLPGRTT